MEERRSMEMDAITAHLDRGWELLSSGDVEGARLSVSHIFKIDPESPEGFTLLGAITVAEGDAQEALEHLQHAIDLDPDYIDGLLYTAEVALHALMDSDLALRLCEDAEEIAREPEDLLDLRLLQVEARISRQEIGEARTLAERLVQPPYPTSGYYLRTGRAWLELGEEMRAVSLLQEALEDPQTSADAHYFLAVALEKSRQPRLAMEHFLTVQELDRAAAVEVTEESNSLLARTARQALAAIAARTTLAIAEVPLEVCQHPPREIIAEGFDPRGVVFFGGMPRQGGGEPEDNGEHLSCVFVYRQNIERLTVSTGEWDRELEDAMVREAELFFNVPLGEDLS